MDRRKFLKVTGKLGGAAFFAPLLPLVKGRNADDYLTDPDAWFLNAKDAMFHLHNRKPQFLIVPSSLHDTALRIMNG